MATETMSQFLEGLHASRLLETERIEELLRRPEPPQGDMDGVSRFLESQGWLTRFQIDEIREGRAEGLMFSGYRLLERLPDLPCGRQFKAYHPALEQAVVVRFVNGEWLKPADDLNGYIERARAASLVSHPNLINVLDAGFTVESPFVVCDYVDGADLNSLVKEMGALPVPLACDYIRQTALGLQAAHERGVFHGDLSPASLILSPVIRKIGVNGSGQTVSVRPSAAATVKLAEMGLVPRRPPAGQVSIVDSHLLGAVHYLAPERLTSPESTVKGDLYSLGATLYFLLAARPPFAVDSAADALQQVQQANPLRIDVLRKDVSSTLADLIQRILSKDPADRPSSAASIAQYLQPFTQSQAPPAVATITTAIPIASETDTRPNSLPRVMGKSEAPEAEVIAEPLIEPLLDDAPEEHHDIFADQPGQPPYKPRRPRKKEPEARHNWGLIILAIGLHVIAFGALALYLLELGPFARSSSHHDKPAHNKSNR